ncbi:hypothetical protein [Pontimicrobium sp. MEBiC01747]|jgi:hypothetical protein
MKTVKVLMFVLAITFTNLSMANTNPAEKEGTTSISKAIGVLLSKPGFEIKKDLLAEVTFMLNAENEIVVLTVDTESTQLENYIKTRLNYNELAIKLSTNKKYKVAVRLIVEN